MCLQLLRQGTHGKAPLLKLKINMPSSAKPCRFWIPDSNQAEWPMGWAAPFKMRISVSHSLIIRGERAICVRLRLSH